MYCPECGHQNPDAAKFCMSCGHRFDPAAVPPARAEVSSYARGAVPQVGQPGPTVIVQKKGSALPALILPLLLGVGGVAVDLYATNSEIVRQKDWLGREKPVVDVNASDNGVSGRINLPEVRQRQQPPQRREVPAPPPVSYESAAQPGAPVVQDTFAVPPGSAKWWMFTVPVGMSGRVTGEFHARGGSGNDIQAAITDENGANGHAGQFWYHTDKVTTDRLDVRLGPGTYYMVFSNRFSAFSSKSVSANIYLELQ
jgi:hypothetical protein